MGIWDETNVDWSTGDGLLVSQLFERAYVDGPAARTLADAVGIAWPTSAATMSHSQLWTALLSAAADNRKLPALAAELLDDPTRAIFTDKLIRVLGDQVGLAHAVGVAKHGLPSSEEEKSAVVETLDFASATEEILPSAGEGKLQAVNPGNAGLQSFSSYIQSLLNARRRVALIRRAQSEVGSGFLVGPDLLLTAAHVLRSDGVPTARDVDQMDVVMDFFDQGRSIDETGIPVPVVEMLRASPATDAELGGGGLPSWDARDDQLDYALLRLGRAIGNEAADDTPKRGWYRLDTAEPDLSRPALVIVLHFPLRAFLAVSIMQGAFQFNPAGTKTRMRYRSTTLPGSSGGPIVDERGRLLGLHHYGLQPANQAVPIWRVARDIEDLLPTLDAQAGPGPVPPMPPRPKPSEVLLVGNRPVVNRDPLRGKLWGSMTKRTAARSMVIVGATDTGVSWSWWLLNHLAGESLVDDELKAQVPRGVKAVRIDLRKDIAKPVAARREALIGALARPLSSETLKEDWVAQVARQVSEFAEWCRRRLPADGPQWWIFIDSIDEARDVKQHGIGEVLTALVDLADDQQVNLRLVLAGKKADALEHESLSFAQRDDTVGLTRQEVKTWLEAMAAKAGRVVDPGKLDTFLAGWFTTAAPAARPGQLTLALGAAVEEVSA